MTTEHDSDAVLHKLAEALGPRGFTRDAGDMAPWLTDWRGRVTGQALALLSPDSTESVASIVRIAAAGGLAITPQGGNSSMVAGATPPQDGRSLLLSLRRMNKIRDRSAEDNSITAEAGVILADLHDAAALMDRRFPLSLAAKGSATVGGLVSTNAGGTQVLRFGNMRGLVLGLEAVLPDGEVFNGLASLRKDNRGYDLRQLLIGAEGTLGIVTAATLRLVAAARQRVVAWVGLDSPQAALRLLRRLDAATGELVESFELIPANGLRLVMDRIPNARAPLGQAQPWNVLIETTSSRDGDDLQHAVTEALAGALEQGEIADAAIAGNEAQAAALWHLRESLPEAERLDGIAVKHDIAVPVAAMPDFITRVSPEVERRFTGARVLSFGHLGDGNIHFNIRAPIGSDAKAWVEAETQAVNRFVHDAVLAAGGTISAEHGIGQTKLHEYMRVADPVRLAAQQAIKRAFDPHGLMNPGKLVP